MANNSKQPEKAPVLVEALSALLDFYSDRATSFASLFVASVFGLVTLSAIIKTYSGNSFWYYIAGIPYFAFVLSASYTWSKFHFWANMAHYIEFYGFREPHEQEIKKITFKIELRKKLLHTNLYEFLVDEAEEQKNQPLKKLLDLRSYSFAVLFFILVAALTIITYWDYLKSNLSNPFFILAVIVIALASGYLGWRIRKATTKRVENRIKRLEEQQKAKRKNENDRIEQ